MVIIMDLKFINDNVVFQCRVGVLIKKDNKILVERRVGINHVTLPGGKIQLNETSILAGIREIKEETGLDIKFIKHIKTLENIFKSNFNEYNYHEILFINEYKLKKDTNKIVNIEDKNKDLITYEWFDKEELIKNKFVPASLIEYLNI